MMYWETISTDYLDRHNDHIQIFVQDMGHGRYFMTDGGEMLRGLEHSGLSLDEYQKRIEDIFDKIGVELEGKALKVSATSECYREQQDKLIKAMVEIDRMAEEGLNRLRHSGNGALEIGE